MSAKIMKLMQKAFAYSGAIFNGGLPFEPLLVVVPDKEPVIWAPDGEVFTLDATSEGEPNASVKEANRWIVLSERGCRSFEFGSDSAKQLRVPSVGGRQADARPDQLEA